MNTSINEKKNRLFIMLSGYFLTCALVAEMVGTKIFSLERTLGMEPANLNLFGYTLDFNLTAGVVIWPFVFVTTDIINEYFGKEGVRRISFLTAGFIAFAFFIIGAATLLPPATFWVDLYAEEGLDINLAFGTIFRQGLGIIIGSLTAFLIGQFLDVYVFHRLRRLTGSKMIWLRATGSTLFSQLIDSFVVLFIAFYIFGKWSVLQVLSVGIINYIFKFVAAIAMTPLVYLGHFFIDRYLGKEEAEKISEEAASKSEGFF
ncbi:MAG: queuosine precursor transporter [Flammeovirgaceae bacterium]|nr:MAG: queuosine precursor transporter [Flammeovirgaceae bacterium]